MDSNILKLDAGESIFFNRELESIRKKTYDVKYDDNFKMLATLPISVDGDPYANEITHRSYGRVGIAKMGGGDYATDYPSVDVFGTETSVKIHGVKASYKYNKDEIMRASKINKPLESLRAFAARKAIDKKLNDVAMVGDEATGAQGLFTAKGVSEYTLANNGASPTTSTKWVDKSADQILADLYGISNAIITATNGIEIPDTIALPLASYQLIEQKRLSSDSEKTVLAYFLETSKTIKTVLWFNELKDVTKFRTGSGVSYNSDLVMFCWKNDADHLVLDLPLPFEQEGLWVNGNEYTVPCRAKTAGVTVFYPMSVQFAIGL